MTNSDLRDLVDSMDADAKIMIFADGKIRAASTRDTCFVSGSDGFLVISGEDIPLDEVDLLQMCQAADNE